MQKDSSLSEWGQELRLKEAITPVVVTRCSEEEIFSVAYKEQRVRQSNPSKSYSHLELTEM